jgi:hypothetical protein
MSESSALPPGWTPAPQGYRHVVSVSIGSSKRDAREELTVLDQHFLLERIGTDGDMRRAARILSELDGRVDAFGLGGTDLYIVAGRRRYSFRDIIKLAGHAKLTPLLDGSGLKHTLEREAIRLLEPDIRWKGCRVLMVSALDRFGMAEALSGAGADMVFGDVIFSLNLPLPLRSFAALKLLATTLLPVVTQLPFQWFYPTGDKQEQEVLGRGTKYYAWADVLAGDFLYIRRYAPEDLHGKIILTNTTTKADLEWAERSGVWKMVTTTPRIGGRSFGTNVMEAFFVALSGKGRPLSESEYLDYIHQIGFKPEITVLNDPQGGPLRTDRQESA